SKWRRRAGAERRHRSPCGLGCPEDDSGRGPERQAGRSRILRRQEADADRVLGHLVPPLPRAAAQDRGGPPALRRSGRLRGGRGGGERNAQLGQAPPPGSRDTISFSLGRKWGGGEGVRSAVYVVHRGPGHEGKGGLYGARRPPGYRGGGETGGRAVRRNGGRTQ